MRILSNCSHSVTLGNKIISDNEPIAIVCETGVTANGDLDTALRLIEVAKEAGADAVKFQTIDCDDFMSDKTITYKYKTADGEKEENMYDMLKKYQFTPAQFRIISQHAKNYEINFYLSVDSVRWVDICEEMGVPAYKIGSWDIRNYPLIEAIAKTRKPVQIDLGPAIIGEVVQLIDFLNKNGCDEVLLVHCSHAKNPKDTNMMTIPYLKENFKVPVGYSADTRDETPDIISVALGTNMLEKRLTLDRNYGGHHHLKGLEPAEFKKWVQTIRKAEALLGEYAVKPSPEDMTMKSQYFTSIVADTNIPYGTIITRDMLVARRPGVGISPIYINQLVGREVTRDIIKNEVIQWEDSRCLD
jgi:sialic acid synthase SpsE